jgi:HK97 family phage major capsid protein
MLNLKKLQELMQKALAEMEALQTKIAEAEEAEDEEAVSNAKTLYDEKAAEFDKLKAKAEEAKQHKARRALAQEVSELAKPETEGKTDGPKAPAAPTDPEKELRAKSEAFYGWMRCENLSGEQRKLIAPKVTGKNEKDAAVMPESLAMKVLGMNYARALGKVMYSFNNPVTNPSAANNLVPPDFRAQLQQLPYDAPAVYDRVTVVTSNTGTVTWPALVQTAANEVGGVSFQWLDEGAQKPETEPQFEQLQISTHELAGYTEISERLLSRSSINLENLLAELFRGAMVYTLDNAIIQGTGVGMPLGIINTAGINLVARNTAGQVVYNDLVNLKHAVKAVHRGGASYTLEDSVEAGLELQTDTLGRPLFNASVANGPYDRLVGYPYTVATNCPALGTSGDIVYGNLRQYVMVMEEEITLARSEHAQFRRNRIAYKVFTVVGGRLLQPRAMAILGEES